MKTFTPSSSKIYIYFFHEVFNRVTPRQSTSYLQLLGIFIMMQRSWFKQMIIS